MLFPIPTAILVEVLARAHPRRHRQRLIDAVAMRLDDVRERLQQLCGRCERDEGRLRDLQKSLAGICWSARI